MMAERHRDLRARHAWVRAVVIVVLLIGLTSLIVFALTSGHRPASQQTSGSFTSPQSQQAQPGLSVVNTPASGISVTEVGLRSGSVQSSSTAAPHTTSATKSNGQTVKAQAKSTKKVTTAKPTPKKAHTTSKKLVKPSKSSPPSDELFPELGKH